MPSLPSAVMLREMTGVVDWLQDSENSRTIAYLLLTVVVPLQLLVLIPLMRLQLLQVLLPLSNSTTNVLQYLYTMQMCQINNVYGNETMHRSVQHVELKKGN